MRFPSKETYGGVAEARRLHRLDHDECGECRHWGRVDEGERREPLSRPDVGFDSPPPPPHYNELD